MKHALRMATLVIFAGVLLTGCRQKRPEWQEFSPEDDFSVMMPAEPKEAGFKFADEEGNVQFHMYKAKYRGHTYRVLTGNIFEESDIGEMMEIGFEARVGDWSVDERDIVYNGFTGKEITSSRPRHTRISRYYPIGDKFYMLSVRFKNKYLNEEDIETFFNSFTVLEFPPVDTSAADTTD